jgi:allantoinase
MSAAKTPRERVPYSAIVDRPPLKLPGGARMVVWTIVNIEDWGIERAMPRTVLTPPMGQPLLPDLPNWAWHEYGMRVGFWRLFDCMKQFAVTPTLALNGIVCRNYPRVARAAKDEGWEFLGHGWLQQPMHKLEDQRAAIRHTIEAIRTFTGAPPRGWESPGLTETLETIDHLAEAGIQYVADWVLDDQPVYISTTHGAVVSVPYTVELNDIVMMLVQHHPAEEMLRRGRDQFDRLYADSASGARVMAISVHPYISGVPHRIRYVEELYRYILAKPDVVHWTGAQIAEWYRAQVPVS